MGFTGAAEVVGAALVVGAAEVVGAALVVGAAEVVGAALVAGAVCVQPVNVERVANKITRKTTRTDNLVFI
jgi:uncharacterized membrane protein